MLRTIANPGHVRVVRGPCHSLQLGLLAGALAMAFPAAAQNGLEDLGVLPGMTSAYAQGMTPDGTVVVGSSGNLPFRWTSGGMTALAPGTWFYARAVDAAGQIVVGFRNDAGIAAVRWDGGVMTYLPMLNGGNYSEALGINAAGDVVVGGAIDGVSQQLRAVRWTAAGIENLGVLPGYNESAAFSPNSAGDVAVGFSRTGGAYQASRWTLADGMASLGSLNGGTDSSAYDVDATGNIVVGWAKDGGNANAFTAFRWTAQTGMVGLGMLNGGNDSRAMALNGAGDVVVGHATDGSAGNAYRGFRWTQATGLQSIEQWLAAGGVTLGPGVATEQATAVSDDGKIVVGTLQGGRSYIARVTEAGSGLIDPVDYGHTIVSSTGYGAVLASHGADLTLNGAHGSPLQSLLAAGRSAFWAGGDIGSVDRRGIDATYRVGEVGLARGVSPEVQVQVALGLSRSGQALDVGGTAKHEGTYVLPEVIWQARPGLYASFSGYYNEGDLRVRRGYLNAGTPDYSVGETGTDTLAVRARLDWRDLWKWGSVGLTPYTSLTVSRTKIGGYTETGGGFPAQWNERKINDQILRVGVDGTKTIVGDVRLSARLEAAHRFGDTSTVATGQILGLMGFAVPSAEQQRQWLRVGAGVDLPLGPGRFSATLNATSQGGPAAYWLATSYRVAF